MAWFESVCWHHHRSVANNRNMDVCPSKYTPKNFRCTEISYYLCVSCWSFVVFSTNSVWPSWYYNIITYTSVGSKHTILEVTIFFYSGISKKKKGANLTNLNCMVSMIEIFSLSSSRKEKRKRKWRPKSKAQCVSRKYVYLLWIKELTLCSFFQFQSQHPFSLFFSFLFILFHFE